MASLIATLVFEGLSELQWTNATTAGTVSVRAATKQSEVHSMADQTPEASLSFPLDHILKYHYFYVFKRQDTRTEGRRLYARNVLLPLFLLHIL